MGVLATRYSRLDPLGVTCMMSWGTVCTRMMCVGTTNPCLGLGRMPRALVKHQGLESPLACVVKCGEIPWSVRTRRIIQQLQRRLQPPSPNTYKAGEQPSWLVATPLKLPRFVVRCEPLGTPGCIRDDQRFGTCWAETSAVSCTLA